MAGRRSYLIYSTVAVPLPPSVPEDKVEEYTTQVKEQLEGYARQMEVNIQQRVSEDLKVKVIH